tara:strand:- start:416 stop:1153 length:738 start_codon:yes stop_codon:yes gene_type:complete
MENNTKEDEIARILENLPADDIELAVEVPTGCRFYKLDRPDEPITVRAMTFEDERAIADARRKGADAVEVMMERCVSNISPDQMFSVDRIAVMFKIREATYGPNYALTMPCSKCNKTSDMNIDINKNIIMRSLPEDFTDPRTITLPSLGKDLVIRMAKTKDEALITGNDFYLNLWRFISDIDGCKNKEVIAEVLKKLPIKDLHILVKEITCDKYGLHPSMLYACPHCSHEEEVVLPITQDFFLGT